MGMGLNKKTGRLQLTGVLPLGFIILWKHNCWGVFTRDINWTKPVVRKDISLQHFASDEPDMTSLQDTHKHLHLRSRSPDLLNITDKNRQTPSVVWTSVWCVQVSALLYLWEHLTPVSSLSSFSGATALSCGYTLSRITSPVTWALMCGTPQWAQATPPTVTTPYIYMECI